jgi:hypothetical protein
MSIRSRVNRRACLPVIMSFLVCAPAIGCGGASSSPSASSAGGSGSGPSGSGSGDYLSALSAAQRKALETKNINNLKQIGLAFHTFHDANNAFPAAAMPAKGGKPLLSWRVAILPYVEDQQLFQEFKQDEPWDSPHNKKLLPRMPKLYVDPRFQRVQDKPQVTYYRGFVGDGGVLGERDGASLGPITNANGASNTFLIVEAGEPVEWTKPEELVFDVQKPLPPFGGPRREEFVALFCDGHVQRIPQKTDEKKLRMAINWKNMTPFTLP